MDPQDLARHAVQAAQIAVQRQDARRAAVAQALDTLSRTNADGDDPAALLRTRRSSWLVAHTDASATETHPAPPAGAYRVLATDGSQIAPDRHDGLEGIGLIHVGSVRIVYGDPQRARLRRASTLVEIPDAGDAPDESELAARRYAVEAQTLEALIEETAAEPGPEIVALVDGSLIAWHLESGIDAEGARADAFAALRSLLDCAARHRVPVAGYVSRPASRDVVNGLRVLRCPTEPVICPHGRDACPCAPLAPATDEAVFARILAPGQRSAVFTARGQATGASRILERYGPHWIDFAYCHAGDEIARIEAPRWVWEDPEMAGRLHAVCVDQADKGHGYPIALSEAHEQAVVRAADRRAFLDRLSRETLRAGGDPTVSAKSRAKRRRAL